MHSTTDSKSNHYTRFFSIPHLFKISHEPNLQSPTNTRIVKGHHTCCCTNLSILAMLNFLRFNSDGGPALSLTRKVSHCHIAAVGPFALLRGGEPLHLPVLDGLKHRTIHGSTKPTIETQNTKLKLPYGERCNLQVSRYRPAGRPTERLRDSTVPWQCRAPVSASQF